MNKEDVRGDGSQNFRITSGLTPGGLVIGVCWASSPRGKGHVQTQVLQTHSPQVFPCAVLGVWHFSALA